MKRNQIQGFVLLLLLPLLFFGCGEKTAAQHYEAAIEAVQDGELLAAAAAMLEALRLEPENPDYQFGYGCLMLALGDTEEARRQLSSALTVTDNEVETQARVLLGLLDWEIGEYETAAERLAPLVETELVPEGFSRARLLYACKDACERVGRTETALAANAALLTAGITEPALYYARAQLYTESGRAAEGAAEYAALRTSLTEGEQTWSLGELTDTAEGAALRAASLALAAEEKQVYFEEYALLLELSDKTACAALRTALWALPTLSAQERYLLTRDSAEDAQYIERLQACVALEVPQAYAELAEVELAQGQYEAAYTLLSEGLSLGGALSALSYHQLAYCALLLGAYETADAALAEAERLLAETDEQQANLSDGFDDAPQADLSDGFDDAPQSDLSGAFITPVLSAETAEVLAAAVWRNRIVYYERTGQAELAYDALRAYVLRHSEDMAAAEELLFLENRLNGGA